MRLRTFFSVALACLALPAFAAPPSAAPAAGLAPSPPTSVLFYPREAQLTVEESLPPMRLPGGGTGFRLAVPANAERATFFAVVGGDPASGIAWEEAESRPGITPLAADGDSPAEAPALAPEEEPLPERRALLEKIVALRQEATLHRGDVMTADTRLALWGAPATGTQTSPAVEERLKLDGALAQQLPPLHLAREKAAAALARTKQRLEQAMADLEKFDAAHEVVHVVIPYAGKSQGAVALRYGYIVPASFEGSYSVSASPADGKVTIEQFATLEQSSGAEWKDVDVALATMPRNDRLNPFALRPWVLSFQEAVAQASTAKLMAVPAMERATDSASGSEPQAEERSTFRLWRLGKRTIAPGAPTRVALAMDTYAATFFYTLRPALEPQGFLTAEVVFPKAVEMPEGPARFFVDGVNRGERQLTLAGEKATLFFGADPLVSAVMTNLASTSGEQGIIRREQTYLKDWEMTVRNARNRTVEVRVEDAVPVAAVDSISVKVASTPSPEEVMSAPSADEIAVGRAVPSKVFRWKASLGTGETLVIRHRVDVTAPADRVLHTGR